MELSRTRGLIFIACAVFVTLLNNPAPLTAQVGSPREPEIILGFLYNFAKYIEWPAEREPMEQRGMTFCFADPNPLEGIMGSLTSRQINNAPIFVKKVTANSADEDCDIIFLSSATSRGDIQDMMARLLGKPVLVVTQDKNVGTIRLIEDENRLRFIIDLTRAKADGLKVSAQLLSLAKEILN